MGSKSNELQIIRVFDAPVKAVWDAWTDLEQVAQWWGPRGFTITTHSKDLRVGGHWKYTMHGPDGKDWPNNTVYHEVEKYKKLVYDHGGNDDQPPLFRVTVLFSEVKGKTKLEMTMALESAEKAEETRKIIKKAGGNSTWDRLAEYLGKKESGKEQFVIARSFAAPVGTLWEMWTDPKHFSQWLPPTGMTMAFMQTDVRAGGESRFSMMGHGFTMYGRVMYVEITPPERLVYKQQFLDERGNISRHPGAPTWPETMLTTVRFFEEGPEQTRVSVTWEPFGDAKPEEVAAFVKERAGMTMGWTGSFDKLDALLGAPVGW